MMQLQNLCMNGNLQATGNRATLIDRLLRSFGPRRKKTIAAPSATELLNNNTQVKTTDCNLNAVELAEKVKENLSRTRGGQVAKQSGINIQNQRLRRTFGHLNSDLDGEEVAKRIERKLASMQARVQVGEGGEELRQKVNLVRIKLQRYYFLAQLLPLSKSPTEFAAFTEKFKEQRLNENNCENEGQGGGGEPKENCGRNYQLEDHQIKEGGDQLSVVTTTNQGLVVQHAQRGWVRGEPGVKVVEEVYGKAYGSMIGGYEEAVKNLVMVLQTLPGGGREQTR